METEASIKLARARRIADYILRYGVEMSPFDLMGEMDINDFNWSSGFEQFELELERAMITLGYIAHHTDKVFTRIIANEKTRPTCRQKRQQN